MVATGGQTHLSSVSRTALHHSCQELKACGLPETSPPTPHPCSIAPGMWATMWAMRHGFGKHSHFLLIYIRACIFEERFPRHVLLPASEVSFGFQQPHARNRDQQTQWLWRVCGGPEGLHRRGKGRGLEAARAVSVPGMVLPLVLAFPGSEPH